MVLTAPAVPTTPTQIEKNKLKDKRIYTIGEQGPQQRQRYQQHHKQRKINSWIKEYILLGSGAHNSASGTNSTNSNREKINSRIKEYILLGSRAHNSASGTNSTSSNREK